MKVKIKRIDKSLKLPEYETEGSLGFDLLVREKTLIKPNTIAIIPANIIVDVPKGYMLAIALRSSTPNKKGLLMPHGIGIIDHDYNGENDEIKIQVYNFTSKEVIVEKGEKIAQGIFIKTGKSQWEEVNSMKQVSRGGFGSTS